MLSVLDEKLIKLNLNCKTKEEVISILGKLMKQEGYVKDSYVDAVLKWEQIHPTGIPSKGIAVAIPHTDSEHVNQSAIAIGVLNNPVEFKQMGAPEISLYPQLIMMLAIDDPKKQVDLLKSLMDIFQNEELLIKIKNAKEKHEILNLLNFL